MAVIKFLVLSDTHGSAFPDPNDLPVVDVVLHCGDLTMIGGLSNYREAIKQLAACPAELKLVIPGNHDVSLDPSWWQANLIEDEDDPQEPNKAHDLFQAAGEQGVRLLSEGTHTITLQDGRSFTIYASPYTPEFGGYAFSYNADENRFDNNEHAIPSSLGPHPAVDIVMTHGPPTTSLLKTYRLDLNYADEHCGCPKLWSAIERAKPRLHCFGHVHEGYGTQSVEWLGSESDSRACLSATNGVQGQTIYLQKEPVDDHASKTCLLNAALMVHGGEEHNKPWLVEMEM